MFGGKILQIGFNVEENLIEQRMPLFWWWKMASFNKTNHRSVKHFFSAGNLWFASLLGTRTHRCLGVSIVSRTKRCLSRFSRRICWLKLVEVFHMGIFWGDIYTYYDGVAAMFHAKNSGASANDDRPLSIHEFFCNHKKNTGEQMWSARCQSRRSFFPTFYATEWPHSSSAIMTKNQKHRGFSPQMTRNWRGVCEGLEFFLFRCRS